MSDSERLHRRASSMRCRSPLDTREIARTWASSAGIRQVVDITALDVLGVPVFVSHRPEARSGSASLAYGKGLTAIDAEVGAYMEAIEYHLTRPGTSAEIRTRRGTPRDVAGAESDPAAALDFCPRLGRQVELDAPLLLAEAEDLATGSPAWVPAELAFCPTPDGLGQSLYGASTNGLASGNNTTEATVHALAELIERDVWSFEFIRHASRRVADDGLPEAIGAIASRARAHHLELVIRTIPNEYDIPVFAAFLFDPDRLALKWFNGGWGCHLDPEIALTRAVTEAAQSRAACVYNGRDESRRPSSVWASAPARGRGVSERDRVSAQIAMVRDPRGIRSWAEVSADSGPLPETLEGHRDVLFERIMRTTRRPIYRLRYTAPDSSLAVIRIVAPRLEHFSEDRMRVGPRLKAAIEASARAAGQALPDAAPEKEYARSC